MCPSWHILFFLGSMLGMNVKQKPDVSIGVSMR